MNEKSNIKKAHIEDLPSILKLQKLAYQSEAEIHDDYTIQPLTQTLEEIEDEFIYLTFFKYMMNERIIGSVRGHKQDDTCYIAKLIVHPDFQNRGIGSRLMGIIENTFCDAARFELFTGYKSKRNLYLYQKLGYRIFKTEEVNKNFKFVYLEKLNR